MPSARRVSGHRTIVLRLDARRRGAYRRIPAWPSVRAMYRATARRVPVGWRLECTGRISEPTSFDYLALVEMSSLDDRWGFGVPLTDFLARIALRSDAEILLVRNPAGRSFGVPLRQVLASNGARLTLGTQHSPLTADHGFPVRVDVPGWTESIAPVTAESIHAVDFAEFVKCP